MWETRTSNTKDIALELKELRVKYTKIVSRCRKVERTLQNTNTIVANLREENETLRLTPLLVKGSSISSSSSSGRPHSAHGDSKSKSKVGLSI